MKDRCYTRFDIDDSLLHIVLSHFDIDDNPDYISLSHFDNLLILVDIEDILDHIVFYHQDIDSYHFDKHPFPLDIVLDHLDTSFRHLQFHLKHLFWFFHINHYYNFLKSF